MKTIDKQKGTFVLGICKTVFMIDNKGLLEKKIIRDLTLLERVSTKSGVDSENAIFAYEVYSLTRDRMAQLEMDVGYDAYVQLLLSKQKGESWIQN